MLSLTIYIDKIRLLIYNIDKTYHRFTPKGAKMKKYLLPNTGNFYKANLHCHTTVSDGSLTPEEVKEEYLSRGYSVVAYTDHEIMIHHHELTDENFLALTGYEMSIETTHIGWGRPGHKVCHICAIALTPDITRQVCWHSDMSWWLRTPEICEKFDYLGEPNYIRVYNHKTINDMIKTARDNGFFVTYNHPTWSQEFSEQYLGYHGMHAMEICNYGCLTEGYDDYNPRVYDEMLQNGERIYCIATDDNHNHHPKNSRFWDSGGGFTMIKAENLGYETITQALLDGNFYASQGPEIHELWYEDGFVHIKCSPADKIEIMSGYRHNAIVIDENGTGLIYAKFPVEKEHSYFRITVTDKNGKPANTNAYYLDELID